MSKLRTNPDFLNGVPELVVLRLLARQPMYGYQLVQSIRLVSNGELTFGEGSIYPVLHKLEAAGWLSSKSELAGGRSRVVYRVTASGTKRLAGSSAEWQRIVAAVERILQGGSDECSITFGAVAM
ncbi:MAG: PadR family transcriptional regulator [Planctomycetia bacterium]|nr:PadR family transcriptional regulator [Planctomycetia bacterium]